MFLGNLCAIQWTNFLVDGVLVLVLLGYMIYCGKRGFVDCFFGGFFSTLLALAAAIFLANILVDATDGLFGLQEWFEETFTEAFSKVDGFDTIVVGDHAEAILKEKNVPAFLVQIVLKAVDGARYGTILAVALGNITAKFAAALTAGIVVFILAKILLMVLRGALLRMAEKMSLLSGLDALLGVIIGVLGFAILVSFVLSVLTVIPFPAINDFLDKSFLASYAYKYNPLVWIFGFLL